MASNRVVWRAGLMMSLACWGCGNGDSVGDGSAAIGDLAVSSGGGVDASAPAGVYGDLPAAPIAAGAVSADQVAALSSAFAAADDPDGAGPCLTEPSSGAMIPKNISPLLFEWTRDPADTISELRVHAPNQTHDLVVYTDGLAYLVDAGMWHAWMGHSGGQELSISLRSGQWRGGAMIGAPHRGTRASIQVSPVDAPGAILYWTTTRGSAIKAFRLGDAAATSVLTPERMRSAVPGDDTQCVGCHATAPDRTSLFVGRSANPAGGPFSLDARQLDGSGARPSTQVVANAAIAQLLRTSRFMPALSAAHYSAEDAVVVGMAKDGDGDSYQLTWTDLHDGSTGVLQRAGDAGQPDAPSFSHDGRTIVYASSDGAIAIQSLPARVDLYTVPYNDRRGGNAARLTGASDGSFNEYYPVYSPGDQLIAFNRIPAGGTVYNAPAAEIFVIPAGGGEPVRAKANDPPQCGGLRSPGITNSWPRWAPTAATMPDGRKLYWLVFSSRRRDNPLGGPRLPQLYVSAVITVTVNGVERPDETFPAVYLTTQSRDEANHTPAWDEAEIPPPG